MSTSTQGELSPFSSTEFRATWLAELLSYFGDQLARVALAILVFDHTNSAALTGLAYALTYVPSVLGALALSAIADRRPRRSVIILVDASRAVVVGAMAIPGMSLPGLCALVSVMSFLGGPYKAAQLALLRDILDSKQYPVAMSIRQVTTQAAQILGFAGGGFISSVLTPQVCLVFNSATFFASCSLYLCFVVKRASPGAVKSAGSVASTTRLLWEEPRRRAIFLTTFLGFFYIAPEAVAAPYVSALGYGKIWVGALLASTGIGAVVGLWAFHRFVPKDLYAAYLPIICFTAGLPLIALCIQGGGIYLAMMAFALSNALWCIQVVISVSTLIELLPDSKRAQGMGVSSAMNLTAQGLGTAFAGGLSELRSPAFALVFAGTSSIFFALWPGLLWIRADRERLPDHLPEPVPLDRKV
ncbi:MFS transporter [Streptomyces rishiriensis]|uniref:MFS family permease n=1 Tax=Streptomyces rishiriensis TaxID=68264 RepID=A0ABU0NGG0_STRRH|nr:MFS transporter [Streptomyces rishiriensis]MDQ0578189.1 MFS family permease [Streptomyces rishiriensis]